MKNWTKTYRKLYQGLFQAAEGLVRSVLIFLVGIYRTVGSQHLGGQCRFYPSCSHYALESLQTHPILTAIQLTTKRILRCHPFGSSGWDPVPSRKENVNVRKQQSATQTI